MLNLTAIALLTVFTTALLIFNQKLFKLHATIGLMFSAMVTGLALVGIDAAGWLAIKAPVTVMLQTVDFPNLLMNWVLPFLLFAGALKVDIAYIKKHRWAIGALSTVGVVISSFLVGVAFWLVSAVLGLPLGFIHCWLLGAILMPTDPVVVSAILKKLRVPKKLEAKIAGESLFNDGASVILFLALSGMTVGSDALSTTQLALLPFVEIIGALVIGLVLGQLACWLLHRNTDLLTELFITISLVLVATVLTNGVTAHFGIGPNMPLTVVIAGLFIGNHGRKNNRLTWKNRSEIARLWTLIDEVLVTFLFVLMGMMLMVVNTDPVYLAAGALVSIISLVSRLVTVKYIVRWLEKYGMETFTAGAIPVLVWGGMRGGISLALVMMLPVSPARDVLLTVTFVVVALSILVQGLTMEGMIKKSLTNDERR